MYMEYKKNDKHNNSDFCALNLINVISSELIPLIKSKPENINDKLIETLNKYQSIIDSSYNDFMGFIDDISKVNENFKFWSDFIHKDCFAYASLYLAIRSGNWSLRNYSIYRISNLFQLSDSRYYFRLLPRHLADLLNVPPHILEYLKNGGFISNITGTQWSSIALDEMTINKDIKIAFTTPSITNVRTKLLYLAYRASVQKNVISQLYPSRPKISQKEDSLQFNKDLEENVGVFIKIKCKILLAF